MKVSIAMATFNGAQNLGAQLESFVRQTRLPDELVVCDDCSTDSTLTLLQEFSASAPFEVRIARNNANLGFTQNFNEALTRCTGDVIFLSDQDDVWLPQKIETVLATLIAHAEATLVIHDGKLVDEDLQWYGATKLSQIISGYSGAAMPIMGALTAIRRELAELALPVPQEIVGHDKWLHLIAELTRSRVVVDDILQLIRRHHLNTSDWIVSSTRKINAWDVFKSQWKTPIAKSYKDRMLINKRAAEVLRHALDAGNRKVSATALTEGLDILERERDALLARERLVKLGWLARKLWATRMLIRGDYRYFNGYRSFLRDLVR
jgi:glycosyltransferase involved in cell wall biosynthesis